MKKNLWRFLLIPSTYGIIVWTFLILLLNFNLIKLDITTDAFYIFLFVVLCFVCSNIFMHQLFRSVSAQKIESELIYNKIDLVLFLLSTAIGLAGLFIYIFDFSSSLGGFTSFFILLFEDPLVIRALAAEETSIGFQLSYFSWFSIFYCIYFLATRIKITRKLKLFLYTLFSIEFSLNLTFIDRTRPVILFMACCLILLILKARKFKNPLKIFSYIFLGPVVIFFIQAIFTEKYNKNDGLFDNFLLYLFGGFGYFSDSINDVIIEYELTRTFYPVAKILNLFGASIIIPSQILEFRYVPFPTNVGTFLEPLYADGGLPLVIFGLPIIIFLTDIISYYAITSRQLFGIFLWANLVIITIFSFFTPKFNSAFFYQILFFYLIVNFINKKMRRNVN